MARCWTNRLCRPVRPGHPPRLLISHERRHRQEAGDDRRHARGLLQGDLHAGRGDGPPVCSSRCAVPRSCSLSSTRSSCFIVHAQPLSPILFRSHTCIWPKHWAFRSSSRSRCPGRLRPSLATRSSRSKELRPKRRTTFPSSCPISSRGLGRSAQSSRSGCLRSDVPRSLSGTINKFRKHRLGLLKLNQRSGASVLDRIKVRPLPRVCTQGWRLTLSPSQVPVTYCWSPTLIPKPRDWTNTIGPCSLCPRLDASRLTSWASSRHQRLLLP